MVRIVQHGDLLVCWQKESGPAGGGSANGLAGGTRRARDALHDGNATMQSRVCTRVMHGVCI